jgi:hypothetical protein
MACLQAVLQFVEKSVGEAQMAHFNPVGQLRNGYRRNQLSDIVTVSARAANYLLKPGFTACHRPGNPLVFAPFAIEVRAEQAFNQDRI